MWTTTTIAGLIERFKGLITFCDFLQNKFLTWILSWMDGTELTDDKREREREREREK